MKLDPLMSAAPDLVSQPRMAAENLGATAEHLQERIYQLEATARLDGETIRSMQQAAAEIERAQWARR